MLFILQSKDTEYQMGFKIILCRMQEPPHILHKNIHRETEITDNESQYKWNSKTSKSSYTHSRNIIKMSKKIKSEYIRL